MRSPAAIVAAAAVAVTGTGTAWSFADSLAQPAEPRAGELTVRAGAGPYGHSPGWRVAPGSAGQVSRPGDVAVVDARAVAGRVEVTVHLTNLAALRSSYVSLAVPLAVARRGSAGWAPARATKRFLTHTAPSVTFSLPGGRVYGIVVPAGGSWLASRAATPVAPELYVEARGT